MALTIDQLIETIKNGTYTNDELQELMGEIEDNINQNEMFEDGLEEIRIVLANVFSDIHRPIVIKEKNTPNFVVIDTEDIDIDYDEGTIIIGG